MKKVYLFAVMLFGISVMNAFPMFYSNYKLVSVTPEGTIVGDRSYENRTLGIDFDDFIGSFPLFSLKNTSGTSLSIMWDLCAFVDASGRSQNVIGTGVSFAERDKQVASTVVIPGDCVYEVMIPSESIESKWIITDSIPKKADQTISLILTVEQQEIQTRYVFSFESVMSDSGVLVESGSFTMGDENEDLWEGCSPAHEVTLTYDFYIGKDEVTFDEYHLFCEDTEKDKPYDTNEIWEIGSLPVVGVSWWDAIAYCNWLSDKEALHRAYDDNGHLLDIDGTITTDPSKVVGYRLPTEAEWEYAARGGSKSKGYKYAGSDNANAVAWYEANSDEMIHKVGLQDPNELRLYDMSGNVWEWCSDTWYEYSNEAELNPYNYLEDNISYRIVRGGSLYSEEVFLRNSSRNYGTPDESYSDTGFRICRTAPYEGENRAPFRPYATSPLNNAISQRTTTILSWDCDDPDGDDIKYDIYFDKNPNPTTLVATDYSDRTFVRSNLSHSTTYYWKIVAKDSKGATTEGPICSFITHEELSSYIPSKTVPDMILVEKGVFVMGDTWGDGCDDEKPTHKVTLTYDFEIGKYEVTLDEYNDFCEAAGRSKPSEFGWGVGRKPVQDADWWDAAAYCNWLSEREGLPKAYDNDGNFLDLSGNLTFDTTKVVGYRLPTEAEWEYAARGGENHSPYRFSGSDNVDDVAWYKENSGGSTHEVGMKLPNTLGIYDMSGNVSEWCSDTWESDYYGRSPEINPYNRSCCFMVMRGGNYLISADYMSSVASRSCNPPNEGYEASGFRICRTMP